MSHSKKAVRTLVVFKIGLTKNNIFGEHTAIILGGFLFSLAVCCSVGYQSSKTFKTDLCFWDKIVYNNTTKNIRKDKSLRKFIKDMCFLSSLKTIF